MNPRAERLGGVPLAGPSHDGSTPRDQPNEKQDDRDDEQKVNERAYRVGTNHPEQPRDEQNNRQRVQHVSLLDVLHLAVSTARTGPRQEVPRIVFLLVELAPPPHEGAVPSSCRRGESTL